MISRTLNCSHSWSKSITITWVITITRKYSSESNFLEPAQKNKNLELGQYLATEFSQTSRLTCIKIHMVSPFETILIKIWPRNKQLWQFLWKNPPNLQRAVDRQPWSPRGRLVQTRGTIQLQLQWPWTSNQIVWIIYFSAPNPLCLEIALNPHCSISARNPNSCLIRKVLISQTQPLLFPIQMAYAPNSHDPATAPHLQQNQNALKLQKIRKFFKRHN